MPSMAVLSIPMSLKYPSLKALVSAMEGASCTNRWDVVCSYGAAQLNKFLAAQYDAKKIASRIQPKTQRSDPLTGQDYTIDYDIEFASPVLSFVPGRSGYANLSMLITSGSYSVTPAGEPKPVLTKKIPASTYTVNAVVPLASLNGTTGKVSQQGDIVTLSDGGRDEHFVILHFKTAGGTSFKITPEPGPKEKDALVTYFLPVLKEHFENDVKEIDYALTSINNKPPDRGETILTPSSFAFASAGDADTGILSIYVQTVESGNPPGNASPSFQPTDAQMLPIPEGHSASIILSNALLRNGFLTPQLTANGFSVSFDTPAEGISAQLRSKAAVVNPGEKDNWVFGGVEYKGLDLTLGDFPLNLLFKQGNMSLHWDASTTSDWSQITSTGEGTSSQYGNVDLSIVVNTAPVPLKAGGDDVAIAEVTLKRDDFTITAHAGSCKWYEVLVGCQESVPGYYNSEMQLTIPQITVALHGLNFFATTNLVAPGQHVFKIDTSAGTQTPHDFLLVGDIATTK
jgi:hypothetical protein